MRRLAASLLVSAVLLLGVQVALAAPTVSGYFETNISYEFGATNPYTFGSTLYRLNVSGAVSDNLSYYGRLQGNSGGQPSIPLAYLTYKNLGVDGLDVAVGRQSFWWSRLNAGTSALGVGTVNGGVSLTLRGAPATIHAYYEVLNPGTAQTPGTSEEIGAHVGYSANVSGFDLGLDGVVRNQLQTGGDTAYGVSASLGVPSFGDLYVEASQTFGASGFDEVHVGSNISLLKEPLGVSAWVEYAVRGANQGDINFQLSRGLVEGLTAKLGGTRSGGSFTFTATLTASASF